MGCCGRGRFRESLKKFVPQKIQLAGLTVANVLSEALRSGELTAEKSVISQRLAICNACPHFQKTKNKCNVCGCFMNAKAGLKAARCPVKKW